MFAQCLKYMIINDLVSSCHLIERADLFVSRCPIKLLFSDSVLGFLGTVVSRNDVSLEKSPYSHCTSNHAAIMCSDSGIVGSCHGFFLSHIHTTLV